MNPDTSRLGQLGPPDLSVTPDWKFGPPGARIEYWLCGDVPDGFRELAIRIQPMLDAGEADGDEGEILASFATQLSDLDLRGMICSAVHDAEHGAWHVLRLCAVHKSVNAVNYLIIDLASSTGPRPEVLAFESRENAERALLTVRAREGDTVTITNERGALLRVRSELIVGARVSSESPSAP